MTHTDSAQSLVVHRGNIYVPAGIYGKYFHGVEAVALLIRDNDIVLMPLHSEGGGGLLLKVKNARGDRVIHAREFLSSLDIREDIAFAAEFRWDSELTGLRMTIDQDGSESPRRRSRNSQRECQEDACSHVSGSYQDKCKTGIRRFDYPGAGKRSNG